MYSQRKWCDIDVLHLVMECRCSERFIAASLSQRILVGSFGPCPIVV